MSYAIGLALADTYEGLMGVLNDGIAYNDYFQSVRAWYYVLYIMVLLTVDFFYHC